MSGSRRSSKSGQALRARSGEIVRYYTDSTYTRPDREAESLYTVYVHDSMVSVNVPNESRVRQSEYDEGVKRVRGSLEQDFRQVCSALLSSDGLPVFNKVLREHGFRVLRIAEWPNGVAPSLPLDREMWPGGKKTKESLESFVKRVWGDVIQAGGFTRQALNDVDAKLVLAMEIRRRSHGWPKELRWVDARNSSRETSVSTHRDGLDAASSREVDHLGQGEKTEPIRRRPNNKAAKP